MTSAPPPEPMAGATRVLEPSGITLVYVPVGEFTMGSFADDSAAHDHEKPAHAVYVDGYWIGQTEVTNEQYERFVEAGGYSRHEYWTEQGWQWKEGNGITEPSLRWSDESFNAPQQLVVGVGWHEAAAFGLSWRPDFSQLAGVWPVKTWRLGLQSVSCARRQAYTEDTTL